MKRKASATVSPGSASTPASSTSSTPSTSKLLSKADAILAALETKVEEEIEIIPDLKEELEEEEGDPEEEILLVELKSKVAGLAASKGFQTVKSGQALDLRRDHVSALNKHTIEVRHIMKGMKIGTISTNDSKGLAPLLDSKIIEIEAEAGDVPVKRAGLDSFPINLKLYGKRKFKLDKKLDFAFPKRMEAIRIAKEVEAKEKAEAKAAFKNKEIASTNEGQATPTEGEFKFEEKDTLMENTVYDEKFASLDILGTLFKEGGQDPAALIEHPCPPGKKDKTMRTDLMSFQRQGLAWMIGMEHPKLPAKVGDPPVQLWVKKEDSAGGAFWFNLATETSQRETPILKRGGLLADEMGLGKTMQTIALIVTDDTGEGIIDPPEEPDDRFDDMTLVVCPLSVASNWTDQFHTHVGSKRLSWHLYHGDGRDISKKELRKNDVVITTYQTIALEWVNKNEEPANKKSKSSKEESFLHKIKWRRIVLDEGHVIKNPKAKMSMACTALIAERRWILTGTPIVNSCSDLGSMMTFLRLCRPLDERAQWNAIVESKGKSDPEEQAKLLRAIISSTTLRRTKNMSTPTGKPLVKLPPIDYIIRRIPLSIETRALYDEIRGELERRVEGFQAKGTSSANYSVVLVFLLRLRQLACDPTLCPQSFIEDVRAQRLSSDLEMDLEFGPVVDKNELNRLQGVLNTLADSNVMCLICGEIPAAADIRMTDCEHIYCQSCIEARIALQPECVVENRAITLETLISLKGGEIISEEAEVLARQAQEGVSGSATAAKTVELVKILEESEKGVKSLIFSQWTSHLNCIEAALAAAGIVACRFDGSMTQQRRETVISSFSKALKPADLKHNNKLNILKGKPLAGPPMVMLISLKAGALGLNLTCASQVFLMDPWWQASIEKQAIDRVYRIGQMKSVKVYQMTASDTVEDRVLEVQDKKQKLILQAFSGNKPAPEANKIEEMVSLFK